eukprot:6173626-Pleurochrysis_carterae.AAC.2
MHAHSHKCTRTCARLNARAPTLATAAALALTCSTRASTASVSSFHSPPSYVSAHVRTARVLVRARISSICHIDTRSHA